MKKVISLLLVLCFTLSSVPIFAANPFEVISEFTTDGKVGVSVKKSDTAYRDFTLYAAYKDEDYVYDVKKVSLDDIAEGKEIIFDKVDGAEIELFAWDEKLAPVEDMVADLDYSTVMAQLKKANDYWITKKSTINASTNPWDVAVFHTGNMQAYFMTSDELYRNYSQKWSELHSWQSFGYPSYNQTNADNICCFRTYLDLYNMGVESADISYVQNQVDMIVNSESLSYWDWIDAFYMAAPTFVRMYELTGDKKYLDKMYAMIKYTAEELNLYDEDAGLWFRDTRFINQLSDNGKKIFWSRGDGWVYAAFAQIIEELPDSYEHKDYFVDIFLEMSKALKAAQCENGAWHESLLDPDYNPDCEQSGTGFFTYGMLWGINNGYLEESEYLDCAVEGWKWLTEVALQDNGSIGYVQYIGSYPTMDKLTASSTEDYAYAIFVFAASEMAKYLGGMQGDVLPYLQKKLLGNIEVYKNGADYAIKEGKIVESNVNCEELVAPEGMYLYNYGDLYIISEFITPFNKTEENLLIMLENILEEGKFPEREESDAERIEITVKPHRCPNAIGATTSVEPNASVAEEVQLTVENITMSYVAESHNGAANAIDGLLSTRMALQVLDEEQPEYVDIDLGDVYDVTHIGMAFYLGQQRKHFFSVSVSQDGENYSEVIPLSYTWGITNYMEYFPIDMTKARYVRIYGYGNNSDAYTWFSVTELAVFASTAEELEVGAVEGNTEGMLESSYIPVASIETESENNADNVNDNDMSTYCVLYVENRREPQYIELDLGSIKDVGYVALAMRNGTRRQSALRIDISEDGENFVNAVPKCLTTGKTEDFEYYPIDKRAKYVRIYGYYNTVYNSYWISYNEIKVYVNN